VEYTDEYYNGSPLDSLGDPCGINVLQKKLDTLEQAGEAGSFEYRKTQRGSKQTEKSCFMRLSC
jgi:hypothetical protein